MSSSNKKTFKTSETTKAIDATVTSDAILLEPTTTGHVLVVTSETAGNLNGNVDVELEMSPDGQNWCPAKVKQVTTTDEVQGDPVEGNEKAVNLIKDTQDAGDYKNKFARGRLEYDLSTNQLYQGSTINEVERTDASDFMHHMIATNKSFNFSGWFNSDQQPSNTYTPVLFRHGGLDTFTNTHVVQTDSNTTTQNLAYKNFLNSNYLEFTGVASGSSTTQSFETTSTTVTSPFYSSANQTNVFPVSQETQTLRADGVNVDLVGGYTIGFWLKIDSTTVTNSTYTSFFTLRASSGQTVQLGGTWRNGNFCIYSRTGTDSTNNQYHIFNGGSGIPNTGWHYITYAFSGSGNNYYAASVGVDGSNPSISTSVRAGSSATINGFNGAGVTIDSLDINTNWNNNTNPFTGTISVDSIVFIEGIVSDTYSGGFGNNGALSLYQNANNPYNANLNSTQRPTSSFTGSIVFGYRAPVVRSFIKLGDGPNDDISTAGSETYESDQGLELSVGSSTTNHSAETYTAGDAPEEIFMDGIEAIFDTAVSSSISGWFKTSDTGTLFSNTGGAATSGMNVDITASGLTVSYAGGSANQSLTGSFNDGEWHNLVLTKNTSTTKGFDIYMDGALLNTGLPLSLSNGSLRGDNGFTLLGDGQENVGNASAASTDASKLAASLSNWSLHSEELSAEAVKQIYSNGHVRNIKNLPSVSASNVLHWWKFSSTTTPGEDSLGSAHLYYQDGASAVLTSKSTLLTDGAPLVQKTLNGNGMTLSLTKKFDFVNEEWVTDASGEAAICLSFNGFEEQAEYFVLWKANQTAKSVNFLDGGWHNLVLSYRGRNDLNSDDDTTSSFVQEGDIVKFGNASSFNWNLSIDGKELNDLANGFGADYIGGLNTLEANNVGFAIYNRHLKFTGNSEETYIAHTQGGATPQVLNGVTVQPALEEDTPYAFQGYIDETSFHSQNFWQTSSGGITVSNFESEYPAVIYGNTNALPLRGSSAPNYATGIPYPLNDTTAIGATQNTSQYVNPDRLDPTTNPHGGLEAWWRWGDTPQDCAENINDAIDYALSTAQTPVLGHHLRAIEIDQGDLILLSVGPASTYLADSDGVTPATAAVEFVNVVIQGIVNTACNVKDVADPILQYLRVKFKGVGSTDLGPGKTEAFLFYKKRRTRRKR